MRVTMAVAANQQASSWGSKEDELQALRADLEGLAKQLEALKEERARLLAKEAEAAAERDALHSEMAAMQNRIDALQITSEMHKQRHFMALALALKLQVQALGYHPALVSTSDLWEQATIAGVPDSHWEEWITSHLQQSASNGAPPTK